MLGTSSKSRITVRLRLDGMDAGRSYRIYGKISRFFYGIRIPGQEFKIYPQDLDERFEETSPLTPPIPSSDPASSLPPVPRLSTLFKRPPIGEGL